MRDEDGATGVPDGVSAPADPPQPIGDQSGKNTPRDASPSMTHSPPVADGDILTGSVPPEEETADTATSSELPAAPPASDVTKARRIARWGPYKRWSWYREIRKARAESPRWDEAKETEQGKLPAAEAVDIPAIWVAELYTPSTVSGLLNGIAKLGWEHGRSSDRSLLKWMSDVRQGRSAGWTSLGLVSPKAKPHFARDREATLPDGIAVAFPMLMSLTPGITALVISFVLEDDAARSLQEPLRATYTTRTSSDPLFRSWHVIPYVLWNRTTRLGESIHTPDFQRRVAVRAQARALEARCVEWVRGALPGAFASRIVPGPHPTAMLYVTKKARPMTDEARQMRAFDPLGLDRDYDSWESDEWPSARMVLPRAWDEEGLRLIFACRREDAFPKNDGYADPESNWTIAQRAHEKIQGLLARWAVSCLLNRYHQLLSTLRDNSARETANRPVSDLKELRSLARVDLFDVGTATREVEVLAASRRYAQNVLEMKYVREMGGEHPELLEEFQSFQKERASQLTKEVGLLLSTLATTSDVTQTISNIRVQRLIVALTIISIGIAVVAIIVAVNASN